MTKEHAVEVAVCFECIDFHRAALKAAATAMLRSSRD